jgi:phosphate transport system ATP-binding protein
LQKGEFVWFYVPEDFFLEKSVFCYFFFRTVYLQISFFYRGKRLTYQTFRHLIQIYFLRQKIGMVFQRPNPFPLSVRDNITFGPRVMGEKKTDVLEVAVEKSLERVGLWKVLKDSLHKNALSLSDEQQQRLCIARLLALKPEIVLMDEPCSALDPIATLRIEELMLELKKRYTVVVVTHNMQQAARVSDETGLMYLGELIEFDNTKKIFTAPSQKITEDYVTGKFG